MTGVILVIQPTTEGWRVTVGESGVVLADVVGYATWQAALAAGQVWVALHRSGVPCLTCGRLRGERETWPISPRFVRPHPASPVARGWGCRCPAQGEA